MNIDQAKTISIVRILELIGAKPIWERPHRTRYFSPFRKERTPSFDVHPEKNIWYDHGDASGGNVLEFVCQWLKRTGEDHTVPDALRWLSNMTGEVRTIAPVESRADEKEQTGLVLLSTQEIRHPALIQYLQARGIPLGLARQYLKHAIVLNPVTKKKFFALSFANEEGGYELRNQHLKACIAPKAITFIRGSIAKPNGIHVFEGFMDFLSVLASRKCSSLPEDGIVLNSLSMLESALPYIKCYGYQKLFSWMHNDKLGDKTTLKLAEFVQAEEGLTLFPMNKLYKPFKDINERHMEDNGLKKPQF